MTARSVGFHLLIVRPAIRSSLCSGNAWDRFGRAAAEGMVLRVFPATRRNENTRCLAGSDDTGPGLLLGWRLAMNKTSLLSDRS
jgi:hypothetical protein